MLTFQKWSYTVLFLVALGLIGFDHWISFSHKLDGDWELNILAKRRQKRNRAAAISRKSPKEFKKVSTEPEWEFYLLPRNFSHIAEVFNLLVRGKEEISSFARRNQKILPKGQTGLKKGQILIVLNHPKFYIIKTRKNKHYSKDSKTK
ncbi:MAG: hypothetical protein D6785_11415 [Planctomycetota bacterium]|nr:MAG: hypothetical protein D6785_11415 [Planctomycetota bacterium]